MCLFVCFYTDIQLGHSWQDNIGQDGHHTGFSTATGAASPGLEGSDQQLMAAI